MNQVYFPPEHEEGYKKFRVHLWVDKWETLEEAINRFKLQRKLTDEQIKNDYEFIVAGNK